MSTLHRGFPVPQVVVGESRIDGAIQSASLLMTTSSSEFDSTAKPTG